MLFTCGKASREDRAALAAFPSSRPTKMPNMLLRWARRASDRGSGSRLPCLGDRVRVMQLCNHWLACSANSTLEFRKKSKICKKTAAKFGRQLSNSLGVCFQSLFCCFLSSSFRLLPATVSEA